MEYLSAPFILLDLTYRNHYLLNNFIWELLTVTMCVSGQDDEKKNVKEIVLQQAETTH